VTIPLTGAGSLEETVQKLMDRFTAPKPKKSRVTQALVDEKRNEDAAERTAYLVSMYSDEMQLKNSQLFKAHHPPPFQNGV